MHNALKIVIKKVDEDAFEYYLNNDADILSQMKGIVGGYIEFLPISDDILLVCNEEGKLEELENNIVLLDGNGSILDVIVGDIFFIGIADANGDNKSLTGEQVSYLLEWLN